MAMIRKIFTFLSLLLIPTFFWGAKKAYIITGPESSGSVFIAQVIAHVTGKDSCYKDWSGYRWNGNLGDDLIIVHLSQPAGDKHDEFYPLSWFQETLKDYDRYFILTTRDVTIIKESKRHRFHCSSKKIKEHEALSKNILSEILLHEKCFIWNFETQIYLKEAYFQLLYDFLGISSSFFPYDLYDANKKYIVRS